MKRMVLISTLLAAVALAPMAHSSGEGANPKVSGLPLKVVKIKISGRVTEFGPTRTLVRLRAYPSRASRAYRRACQRRIVWGYWRRESARKWNRILYGNRKYFRTNKRGIGEAPHSPFAPFMQTRDAEFKYVVPVKKFTVQAKRKRVKCVGKTFRFDPEP